MSKLDVLKINNHLDLDLPGIFPIEQQTDYILTQTVNEELILRIQNNPNATFVLMDDNSCESKLVHDMCQLIFTLFDKKPKILRTSTSKAKSDLFKANYHRLKHSYQDYTLISPYHPIFNTKSKWIQKYIPDVSCPLQHFSSQELHTLCKWFMEATPNRYCENNATRYLLTNIDNMKNSYSDDYVFNIYHFTKTTLSEKMKDVIYENNQDDRVINIYVAETEIAEKIAQQYNPFFKCQHRISNYSLFNSQIDKEIIASLYKEEDVKYYCDRDYMED